ncbi:MAG: PfkB family carbohydrate kinase [Tepidisphaerales bacterium]
MTRQHVCRSAARQLADARLDDVRVTIGLDGFVDEICDLVDTRADFRHYTPMDTIATFGRKVLAAAGHSSNYELVVKQMKLGGNGPIMANALAMLGLRVTYVGATGYPTRHPVFDDFATRAEVLGFSDPGHTDAVEFRDGKLMLGKLTPLAEVTWDHLVSRVGVELFIERVQAARLIAANNWTMVPQMTGLLEGIRDHVLPKLTGPRKIFFVDLADPEKRRREDLLAVLRVLSGLQPYVDVTLGLNLKESVQVAVALGLPVPGEPEKAVVELARSIRRTLSLHGVVIHPRASAAAAVAAPGGDDVAHFDGPFIREPRLSTGAGDHFNAGFALGRILGATLAESLCLGVATSGFYVRQAASPTQKQLAHFVENLPDPEM